MITKVFPIRASQIYPHSAPNSPEALAHRARSGRLPWTWPLIMTFIRLPLILVGQLLTWVSFAVAGPCNAWMTAVGMTNFYLPLTADLGCVFLLVWLLQRETITFGDLVGFSLDRLIRDILIGLGLFIVSLILFQVTSLVASLFVYGPGIFTATYSSTAQSNIPMPPLWVAWWCLLILPIAVGIVEELTYRGYVLPRLLALTGRTWLASLIVAPPKLDTCTS